MLLHHMCGTIETDRPSGNNETHDHDETSDEDDDDDDENSHQ